MNIVQKLSDNTKEYIDNFYKILDEMTENMRAVSPNASISDTFIRQMIPHHEAAIKMSENILNFTTDTAIEELAKNIITDQTKEISKMQYMLEDCSAITNSEVDINLYMREYNVIFDNMIKKMNNSSSTNNLNANFLTEMIPHHESTKKKKKNVLKYEICQDLKKLAENIVVSQSAQLTLMQNLLRGRMF